MKFVQPDRSTADRCRVSTYDVPTSNRHIKVAATAERYAFSKDTFASGGEGRIFAACDLHTKQPFCVKEIRLKPPKKAGKIGASVADWANIAERAIAEVDHAWLVSRAFGPTRIFTNYKQSKLYIVQKPMSGRIMTAVEGLSVKVPRSAVVPFLALSIAEDVKSIHDAGVLHFDIKPENICFNKQTMEVEILDFGLSVHGTSGYAEGTSAGYSSREQMLVQRLDRSADVFSLGATLGELALGRRLLDCPTVAFDARDLAEVVRGTSTMQDVVAHYRRYVRDLRAFHPGLAILISDMMHENSHDRPTIADVIRRLGEMQPSAAHIQTMAVAWRQLPSMDAKFERCSAGLHAGLRRIERDKLGPINSK